MAENGKQWVGDLHYNIQKKPTNVCRFITANSMPERRWPEGYKAKINNMIPPVEHVEHRFF